MTGTTTETNVGGGAAATTTTTAEPWFKGAEPDMAQWLGSKGWDKLEAPAAALAAATARRALESQMGRLSGVADDRILIKPNDGNAAEAAAFYKALGRPDDPAGYELPDAMSLAAKAHELNLTKAQAAEIAAFSKAEAERVATEQTQLANEKRTVAQQKLTADWGSNYDEFLGIARRGMAASGLSQEDVDAMEQATSKDRVMNHFLTLGRMTAEGRFVAGTPARGDVLSGTEAEAQMAAMQKDPTWVNDPERTARMNRLIEIKTRADFAAGGGGYIPAGGRPSSAYVTGRMS